MINGARTLTTNIGGGSQLGSYFTPYAKVNSEWIQKLNVKNETRNDGEKV